MVRPRFATVTDHRFAAISGPVRPCAHTTRIGTFVFRNARGLSPQAADLPPDAGQGAGRGRP